MEQQHFINLAYLVAGILFILGLKGLTHPRTAVRGNLLGAFGMLLAVVATLCDHQVLGYTTIALGIALGAIVGAVMAIKVQMTTMPQLVALFNGLGGGASVLVAFAALALGTESIITSVAIVCSGLIGAVTFWGSLIAFGKLQELDFLRKPIRFSGQQWANLVLAVGTLLVGLLVISFPNPFFFFIFLSLASVLGITLVLPIGGADMPVVIALLNSYSGLAAAATGFVVDNNVLIIAGSLVGASGVILTQIMCKAMNRSLFHVLFGVLEAAGEAADADEVYAGKIKSTSADEVAMLFDSAERVVVVPGYGMAVAQAQHAVRELANDLESRGVEVEFAIHPVAGRMPGHMNVLLAEAEVPYEKLKEMDEINPSFAQTDVVLVIGANDVVNPDARNDPASPIAGMPILNVDQARTVVVVKRSLSPGFAGVPNPLFAADNCLMFFGDGKQAILDLNRALKES
ncbi:MAG: NAD(P)(+) transhydrogenase (Re/Si-specific) subunit beta [Pirellulales bacterium]|jgi:NAD(P) transhydrogenase subunit beta|nr:NAD(P)(+) transhydrogenase (Re/Si-specific) subunit beta [Pirellulales bacterium]